MDGDSTASTSNGSGQLSLQDSNLLDIDDPEDITLSVLLARTLTSCDSLLTSPSLSTASSQSTLTAILSSLSLCASLIDHLSLLSANESIEELSTSTIRCFLVPYYAGMVELQRRTKDYKSRMEALNISKKQLELFLNRCEQYQVVDEQTRRKLFMLGNGSNDPARRREAKIAQYKEEKALQARIDVRHAVLLFGGFR